MALLRYVPEVDLGKMKRTQATRTFGRALETIGFVVVTNHGIPTQLIEDAYDAAKTVFSLSEQVKSRYSRPDLGYQYGYTPFGTEHAKDDPRPDLKEFWHIHRSGGRVANVFPQIVPVFERVMTDMYTALDAASVRLLYMLSEYMGTYDRHFADMVHKGSSLLRVLHYPKIEGTPDGMRSAPHEDINLFTLLVAATTSGLEIKTKDGEWIPVNNPPNAIIVNCADMLQLHTAGRLPSMTHRVVNGDGGERFSMPFFVHPRPDVVLSSDPRITAGEYLDQRLREIGVKA